MTNINIIACGGCGSAILGNMVEQFYRVVTAKQAPKLNLFHIDTSTANKHLTDDLNATFHHIKTGVSEKELLGSGGLRSSNVTDASISIEGFLNETPDILSKSALTVLVSSASGGSGSVISPLLMSHLIKRDIPYCVFLIGDSSTLTYAINTSDTLKTFHSMAIKYNTTVPIYYLDNNEFPAVSDVNSYVSGAFTTLSLFFIKDNIDIDFADMATFLKPANMRPKIDIASGIYFLEVLSGKATYDANAIKKDIPVITARVLKGGDNTIPSVGLNQKEGALMDKDVSDLLLEKGILPIIVFTQTNKTTYEIEHLDTIIKDLTIEAKVDQVNYTEDDNGLVL